MNQYFFHSHLLCVVMMFKSVCDFGPRSPIENIGGWGRIFLSIEFTSLA